MLFNWSFLITTLEGKKQGNPLKSDFQFFSQFQFFGILGIFVKFNNESIELRPIHFSN